MAEEKQIHNQSFEIDNNDEIDLKRLFNSLWKTRWLVLMSVLGGAFVLAGVISFLRIALPQEQIFQHQISFTFAEANAGKYPNGANFSINDLLAPEVLKRVYQDNELAKYNINFNKFTSWISVYPYSSKYDHVVERYQSQLSNRKLSFVERQGIENKLYQEIQGLLNQSAQIRLTLRGRFGISKTMGAKIVRDIPAAWAKINIEQKGILNFSEGYETKPVVDLPLLVKLDYLQAIDLLRSSVSRLVKRIEKVQGIPGSMTVVDDETEHTLASMLRAANDLESFGLQELHVITLSFAIAKSRETNVFFFKQKLKNLLRKQESFRRLADATALSILSYANGGQFINQSALSPTNQQGAPVLSAGIITQVDSSFLESLMKLKEEIMRLKEESGNRSYHQQLVNRRLMFLEQEIEISAEVTLIKEILDTMSNNSLAVEKDENTDIPVQKIYLSEGILSIAKTINSLWKAAENVQGKLSFKRMSYSKEIYNDDIITGNEAYRLNHPVLNFRVFVLFLSALFVIMILSTLVGLFRQHAKGT